MQHVRIYRHNECVTMSDLCMKSYKRIEKVMTFRTHDERSALVAIIWYDNWSRKVKFNREACDICDGKECLNRYLHPPALQGETLLHAGLIWGQVQKQYVYRTSLGLISY